MTAIQNFTAWLFGGTFIWAYLLMTLISAMTIRQNDSIHLRFSRSDPVKASANLFLTLLWGAAAGAAGSGLWTLTGMTLTEQEGMVLWMVSFGFTLLGWAEFGFLLTGAAVSAIGLLSGGASSDGARIVLVTALCQTLFGLLVLSDGRRDGAAAVVNDPVHGTMGGRVLSRMWVTPVLCVMSAGAVPMPLALPMGMGMIAYRESPAAMTVRRGILMAGSGVLIAAAVYGTMGLPGQLPILYGLVAAVCAAGWLLDRRASGGKREPWCGWPRKGIRVLDVHRGSVGERLGLRPGDVVLRLNGAVVMQETKIEDTLEKSPPMIWVDYERNGRPMTGEYADYQHGVNDLGIVPLARNMDLYLEAVPPARWWFGRRGT